MRAAWVTGTGGFVGGHLARRLAAGGWRVSSARVRPGREAAPPPAPADVVFHAAGLAGGRASRDDFLAANCALPKVLYEEAARRHCRGFVFISTAKVLGEVCAAPATEEAPRRPLGPYAQSKALAEERLLQAHEEHGLPLVIVRPPLVYGAGVGGGFRWLLRCLARGVPLPLADARGLRSMVSATNLADALALLGDRLADAPGSSPCIRHVTDGEDTSTAALCGALAEALGREARLWRLPPGLAAIAERRAPRAFAPLRLDDGALRKELDWAPPQSRAEAIRGTVRWFNETVLHRR